MPSTDVLLTIPTESIAVRAIVGSIVALLLVSLLLRAGLRLPRIRVAAVLVPTGALAAVVAMSWRAAAVPSLMMPADAINALALPLSDRFVRVAPTAWPLLVAGWALVAGTLAGFRLLRARRAIRTAAARFHLRATADIRVRRVVAELAGALRVAAPPVAVVNGCGGGATVVGIRRPVLVVDRRLALALDDEELEGLVAHELAHVKRRDNLVALLVGVARDLAFFVPGGRWVLRRLHVEREVAADQLAVEITGKPGALASGLLKVLDTHKITPACAALAPAGSLVTRVHRLCDDRRPPGRVRMATEASLIAAALGAAVLAAIQVPAVVAAIQVPSDGQGGNALDGVALLYTRSGAAPAAQEPVQPEATAFAVYRANRRLAAADTPRPSQHAVDDGRELNPLVLRSYRVDPDGANGPVSPAALVGYSPVERRGLGIRPRPQVEIRDDLITRYVATPLVAADDGFGVFLLTRVPDPR